ncbi:unnamed protein product [Gordionus sp. m RMFG-2023]
MVTKKISRSIFLGFIWLFSLNQHAHSYKLIKDCPDFSKRPKICQCISDPAEIPSVITRFPPGRYEDLNGTLSDVPLMIIKCSHANASLLFGDEGLARLKDFYRARKKWASWNVSSIVLLLERNFLDQLGYDGEAQSEMAKSEFQGLEDAVNHLILFDNRISKISQITFAPLFENIEVLTIVEKLPGGENEDKQKMENIFFVIMEALEGEMNKLVSLNLELSTVTYIPQGIFRNLKTPKLRYFSFKSNSLKDVYDGSFEGINKNMTEVYLHGKRFKGIPWNALNHFTELQQLCLSIEIGNLSVSKYDHVFRPLPSITRLNLAGSYIESILDNAFPLNSSLTDSLLHLNLEGVSLKRLSPDALAGLPNLKGLYLSENSLESFDTKMVSGLKNLELLSLDHNKLKSLEDSSEYPFGSKLLKLQLSDNELEKFPANFVNSLTRLEELDVSRNNLTLLGPLTFPHGTKIRSLLLAGNNIKEIPSHLLSPLRESLEVLDLSRNALSDLPKYLLNNFPKLSRLNVGHNNLKVLDIVILFDQMVDMSESLKFMGLLGNGFFLCKRRFLSPFLR